MHTGTYFVTGTDTGVGKTHVACTLLKSAQQAGYSTAAFKPLAAGGEVTPSGMQNEDALRLQQACTLSLSYEEINPLCLQQAIAPHLAAQLEGITLSVKELGRLCLEATARDVDFMLIEGAGGWKVPLNESETMADLVRVLNIPVILVVGMRLGCINHALLSAAAIKEDGLKLYGWIANQLDPAMPAYRENITTLEHMIDAPMLAEIGWEHGPQSA